MKPGTLRWFAAMAALVLTAVTFEENSSQASGGSVYRDPRGRFTVQVPAGWNAGEAEGGARLSHGNAYAKGIVMDGTQEGWDLGEQIVGQVRQQWRNFREIDRGERQLGALPAKYGLYTGVNPKGISGFLKVFVAPGPGRTFVMLLSCPAEELASMAGDITEIEHGFSAEGEGSFAGGQAPGPTPGYPSLGSGPQPSSPQPGPQPSPNRAILGVMCRDLTPEDMATVAATVSHGTLIVQVGPNTPAARAGLQPKDVIGAIDRRAVLNTADLIRIIGGYNPGAVVEIFVIRQGRPQAFRVQLAGQVQTEATRPTPSGAPPPSRPPAGEDVQPPWILSPVPAPPRGP